MGDALMARQRYQAAIEAYKKAPPDDATAWNKLGIAYQMMFNVSDAMRSECEIHEPPRHGLVDLDAFFIAQAVDYLRRNSFDGIHTLREQSVDTFGVDRQRVQRDGVPLRACAPVLLIPPQLDGIAVTTCDPVTASTGE
jgi:hypothetical protein